ncbi:MAG: DOMON domain-containing protein [Francisellaceae bacterium]
MLRKLLLMVATLPVINGAYAEIWEIDDNYQIVYNTVGDKIQIKFILKNNKVGWMGLGFNEFMFPADCIVVWWDDQIGPIAWDAYNPGIPTLPMFPAPIQDVDPLIRLNDASPFDNKNNVKIISSSNENGTIVITVERDLNTKDVFDRELIKGQIIPVVAAYNDDDIFINEFGANQPMHTNYGAAKWRL